MSLSVVSGVCALESKIYVLSGHDGENSFYHSIEEYDIDSDTWNTVSSTILPYGRCRFGCVALRMTVPSPKTWVPVFTNRGHISWISSGRVLQMSELLMFSCHGYPDNGSPELSPWRFADCCHVDLAGSRSQWMFMALDTMYTNVGSLNPVD